MTEPPAPRRLTFAQRVHGVPVPQQMRRDEASRPLRIKLYIILSGAIGGTLRENSIAGWFGLPVPWRRILHDLHTEHRERMPDEFEGAYEPAMKRLKGSVSDEDGVALYGDVEFILRHPDCPNGLAAQVNGAFEETQAPYRVVGGDTLVPHTSDEEIAVVSEAFHELEDPRLKGARAHYRAAAEALTAGDYAGSMRESIHAVESITKLMTGKKTLQDGVSELAKHNHLHGTVQAALEKIAAWTNAVAGIRHANEAGAATPAVNEDDAVFLLGLCGATISYLKRRGEKSGLLK